MGRRGWEIEKRGWEVGKKGAISDDYFVLNCTWLRTLMEPGFQGERFGDTWERTLEITQSRDRQSFKRSGHSFERKVRKPGERTRKE